MVNTLPIGCATPKPAKFSQRFTIDPIKASGLNIEVARTRSTTSWTFRLPNQTQGEVDLRFRYFEDTRLLADGGLPTFGTVDVLGDLVPEENMQHLRFSRSHLVNESTRT